MSVVDLATRVTTDWQLYVRHQRSSESLIFFDEPPVTSDGPASAELVVGDGWYDCSTEARYHSIPPEGLVLGPRRAAVIVTRQRVAVPLNVFGLVTGKGKYIFQGVFISSGKIDPGFANQLRIGLLNAGPDSVTFKPGDPFCTCCFLQMESGMEAARQRDGLSPGGTPARVPWATSVRRTWSAEWIRLLPIVIATAALAVAAYAAFFKKTADAHRGGQPEVPAAPAPRRQR